MNIFKHMVCSLALACLAQPSLAQAPVRAPGKLIQLNGIDMHYEERGSGEPLLLLHGFTMCGPGDWGHVADELAKSYRVIMPDLRGHGWSTNPSGVFTMRQSSEDIRALLDHLGLAKVRAMGISAGGMTLLHLATKYPERVEAMVLIGATNEFPQQARDLLGGAMLERLPPELLGFMRTCAPRGDEQVQSLLGQFRGLKDSYDDMNLKPATLGTIKAKTLIVHGDRDEFFPAEIPLLLYRSIPGSQLWIVPNGDHVPIFDARKPEFQRITRAFLANPKAR